MKYKIKITRRNKSWKTAGTDANTKGCRGGGEGGVIHRPDNMVLFDLGYR